MCFDRCMNISTSLCNSNSRRGGRETITNQESISRETIDRIMSCTACFWRRRGWWELLFYCGIFLARMWFLRCHGGVTSKGHLVIGFHLVPYLPMTFLGIGTCGKWRMGILSCERLMRILRDLDRPHMPSCPIVLFVCEYIYLVAFPVIFWKTKEWLCLDETLFTFLIMCYCRRTIVQFNLCIIRLLR